MWAEIKGPVSLDPVHLVGVIMGADSTAMPRPLETIKEITDHHREAVTPPNVSFTLHRIVWGF